MKAKLLRVEEKPSVYGGTFFYFFFKGDDSKSYRSCVSSNYRNFKNWKALLDQAKNNPWIDGLFLSNRSPRLINADSLPRIVTTPEEKRGPIQAMQESLFNEIISKG